MQLQFMFWFITSVFGIKTKSAPKKLISLLRTYLNSIRELGLQNPIFGCNINFPHVPNPRPALIEGVVLVAGVNPLLNDISLLCLAYDPYTINRAFDLYKKADDNLRGVTANSVFKIDNTIAIRKTSLVLKQTVLSRLTVSFSKKPRGQAYVNQSSMFMIPILTTVIMGIEGILLNSVIDRTIGDILSLITRLAPNILKDNPYNPPEHDISKFMDFKTDPQYYRNNWIVYFVTEIFNSHNDGDNFFNHVVLLILLFRYLTLLPADAISDLRIEIRSRTTSNCIEHAKALIIKTYACHQLPETDVAQEQGIDLNKLQDDIDGAARDTRIKNEEVNAAAAFARANVDARADAVDAYAVRRGIYRDNDAARAALALAAPPDHLTNKRKRRGGGTICLRNPHSPKKTNNHTRRNKYKRNNKNKNKKHKSSPKYRKINPSSRSGSQSNKKKSKSKLPQKNVTFKRRRYNK